MENPMKNWNFPDYNAAKSIYTTRKALGDMLPHELLLILVLKD